MTDLFTAPTLTDAQRKHITEGEVLAGEAHMIGDLLVVDGFNGPILIASDGSIVEIVDETAECPACGSDDLGVFAATADREDEADLIECNACRWTASLTPEGAANIATINTRKD